MNLKDRIALIKAGYTKDEIKSFIDADETDKTDNENPTILEQFETLKNEVSALKDSKKAEQEENIKSDSVKGESKLSDDDIMSKLTDFIMGVNEDEC